MPSAVNSKDIEELINGLKSGIGLWEDLISKSAKFSNSIKSMTTSCSDLLDSMHTVCDLASKSSCGLRNTGISLTKLVLREKKMELKVTNVSNALNENLVSELEKCVNEWKRSSAVLKKEREHEWRRANLEYQKSLAEVDRTEKKLRKKNAGKVGLSETASLQIEYANQDAQNKRRYVEELERSALRRAAIEERQRFKQFLGLLKPILDCQLSMREDLDNLEEVIGQLYGEKAENLDSLPDELEQSIQEHMIKSTSKSSIARSYSTLSKQQSSVSNGSRTSLNSNSMSTTSSEWNNNNGLINACMEVSSRLNENMSNISHDSGIRSDRSFAAPYDVSSSQEYEWDRTLSHVSNINEHNDNNLANNESESDDSSTEDDNDNSTDHNSQDGIIDNNNDQFLLPARHSQEEPHFELPPDYPDSLPPPPPPSSSTPASSAVLHSQATTNTVTQSHYSQSFVSQRDALYPNQSIPSPVYSNLMELKINAAKKFGANTLSRPSYKDRGPVVQLFPDGNDGKGHDEGSTSFTSGAEKEKSSNQGQKWTCGDLNERDLFRISPPPYFGNIHDEPISTFGSGVEQDHAQTTLNRPSGKGDVPVKSSMLRRASFATEMQVPQTPKTPNNARRPSVQEQTPAHMYSNKNRGRSMSVTRETNYEPDDDDEQTAEDFNTIRSRLRGQRIVSRINSELKPPTLPKPDPPKKQSPNANYMSYDYSHNLSSPVAVRSNRFFSDRPTKHSIPQSISAHNPPQMKYQQQARQCAAHNQDMESAAGEEPASNDFEMDHQPMTVGRKEERFKQQLMQVLHASKSQEGGSRSTSNPNDHTGQVPAPMSSFYQAGPHTNTNTITTNNPYGKPKGKSSIPNAKYIY